MKINDYFYLVKTRICGNKKGFIFGAVVIALAVMIVGVLTTIVATMASASFVEMREMSFLFDFYAAYENNAIYRLVSIIFVLSEIISACVVVIYLFKSTFSRKVEYKNKLMIGASYSNLVIETLLYNFAMVVLGFVVGAFFSYLASVIICALLGEAIVAVLYIYLITAVVFAGGTFLASVVPVVWVNA